MAATLEKANTYDFAESLFRNAEVRAKLSSQPKNYSSLSEIIRSLIEKISEEGAR